MKLLDERYEKKVCKVGGLFVKKKRILGEPSSSPLLLLQHLNGQLMLNITSKMSFFMTKTFI